MGKSRSRWGSERPSYRAKAEHCQRVDVRQWVRGDYLRAGRWFKWSWHRNGDPSGSISVRVDSPTLVMFEYSVGIETQRQSIKQVISISRLPCYFGGTRAMFCCPACGRAAALLYMRGSRFACRRCQQISYMSQSEDTMARTWRKQTKVETRLDDHLQRPKGMRLRTYEGLLAAVHHCEDVRDSTLYVTMKRLGYSLD